MKNLKKTLAVFLLAVVTAAGCLTAAPSAAQEMSELGKIIIPRDFELETDILDKGEYRLVLDEDGLTLVYRTKDGLECSRPLPSDVGKAAAGAPAVSVETVKKNGADHILIRACKGGTEHKAYLRCAVDGPNRVLSAEDLKGLDPQITGEVKVLAEAVVLMDRFAGRIWPDWKEYRDLEYTLRFPNQVAVVLTAKERMPALFHRLPFEMPDGKHAYVDSSARTPGRIDPMMTCHGQGDYLGVNLWLFGDLIKDGAKAAKSSTMIVGGADGSTERYGGEASGITDPGKLKTMADGMRLKRMLTYVHECFHVMQARRRLEADKNGLLKPGVVRWDRDFSATLDYAVNSELQAEALLKALAEKDRTRALQYLKEFFTARELMLREMSEGAAACDIQRTTSEGTATFSNVMTAMLIREAGLDRAAAGKSDPVSAAYQLTSAYLADDTDKAMNNLKGETLQVTQKFYIYGCYWCLVLDRLFPEWKTGLFENDRTLDEVTAGLLKMTGDEKKAAAAMLKTDLDYDGIYARHSAAIKERDDALAAVNERRGRRYSIDISKAGGGFDIYPRKGIIHKRQQIFPLGVVKIVFGSLVLTSKETPMVLNSRTIEWVDTEAKAGEKGYELKYASLEGGIYRDVTLKTRGFSMTAGRVEITEEKDLVTIKILP